MYFMIKIIPEPFQRELSMAIAKGDFENIKIIIEQNNIAVDAIIDTDSYQPVLMKVLCSLGISNETKRVEILRYFLEKKANPNTNCKAGYNCLHVAVQQEKLIESLNLFLDFRGDVNITDNNGATIAYWALQSFPWRKEGKERQSHLDVLEKILMLGADLDYKNNFGVTPRNWLEHVPEDVKQLVIKCESLKLINSLSETIQPDFPTNLKYPEIADKIRRELIPQNGQADTVQGELLRAIDKLKYEAQGNGNINYAKGHNLLAKFILDTLRNSSLFDHSQKVKIELETKKLMKGSSPYTDDDVYDYLTDQVCIFYLNNIKLVNHKHNPLILH
jgi:hypothetical protein